MFLEQTRDGFLVCPSFANISRKRVNIQQGRTTGLVPSEAFSGAVGTSPMTGACTIEPHPLKVRTSFPTVNNVPSPASEPRTNQ
jgi:hypothetical protein